jgi:Lectin C-type domain
MRFSSILLFCTLVTTLVVSPHLEPFERLENFWLSLTDSGRNGNLYWDSTGKFLGTFNDWMEGEPSLSTSDSHCTYMAINTNVNDKRRWKTETCYARFRYICESFPPSTNDLSEPAQSSFAKDIQNTTQGELERFRFRNSIYEVSDVKVCCIILCLSLIVIIFLSFVYMDVLSGGIDCTNSSNEHALQLLYE